MGNTVTYTELVVCGLVVLEVAVVLEAQALGSQRLAQR